MKNTGTQQYIDIDIDSIPEWDMKRLCRSILEATKKMLEDPVIRADYEAWREEYHKTHPEKEEQGSLQ